MQKVELIQKVKCCDIMNDPNNPRKEISGAEDLELQRSIKEFGIIQPIMVRPVPGQKFKYMIVYGHRRFDAYCSLNAVTISCIIKDLNDAEALEYQIIENLQRKGINPMEESNAFHRLLKNGLSTAEMIADKMGVSTKYVYDRLALQKVIPEVQEAVMTGKISITHGKQFARLPLLDQGKLLKNINISDRLQVHEIRSAITNMFKLNLAEAVFNIDDAALVTKVGSCLKCRKRSGCNQLLFEEVQMEDVCFDSTCYDGKVQAHIDEQIEKHQAAGKTVKLLSTKYSGEKDGLINARDWDQIQDPSSTVGIFLEVNSYGYQKVGEVINLKDGADYEEEDVDEDDSSVSKAAATNSINYRDLFMEKCMEAVLVVFNNESSILTTGQKDLIIKYAINIYIDQASIVRSKILTALALENESGFKSHVEEMTIYELLRLIALTEVLEKVSDFDGYPDQEEIEAVAAIFDKTDIDFFKIAEEVNAPYPLFTPADVATTTEA